MKIFLLLAFSLIQFVSSTVIGIDFGNEYFKVALISAGKSLVIIENSTSKRKTHNAIAFHVKERQYESDGVNKKTKNPRNTFIFMNKFLGALANDQSIITISKQYFEDYLITLDPTRNTFAFQIDNFKLSNDEDDESVIDEQPQSLTLKVEEIIAMILKYCVQLVLKQYQVLPKDAVITVPAGWTIHQRNSLVQAAKIAGLDVLGLMKENSAAALYYALERQDNNTHRVLFFNMGSYHIQATVAEYGVFNNSLGTRKLIETVNILADCSIDNVGGAAYDLALAQYFQSKMKSKVSKRNFLKLLKASNKYKEVLSANKDVQVFIEGINDGNDFISTIKREEFEEAVKPLLDQIIPPIERVLKAANLTIHDINVVELIGGGVRVPKVQQVISDYFQTEVEIGTHLNGDESMALGAAFHAANMSHSFRVRPVHFQDAFEFDIQIEITHFEPNNTEINNNTESQTETELFNKSVVLFPAGKRFGARRAVTLFQEQNIKIDVYLNGQDQTYYYATYYFNNISEYKHHEKYKNLTNPRVRLEFELNSAEYITVRNATVQLNETVEVDVNVTVNATKNSTKNETKKEEQKEAENNSTSNTTTNKTTIETKKVNKTVTHEIQIDITREFHLFTSWKKSEIEKSKALLRRFEFNEEKFKNLSEIKNKLESFIYYIRDIKDNPDFQKFGTPEERELLVAGGIENQQFFESEAAPKATLKQYTKRYIELTELIRPMINRLEELKARPQAINDTVKALDDYERKLLALNTTMPWIKEEEKFVLMELLRNTSLWLRDVVTLQQTKELHEDPVFLVNEITPKLEEISKEYSRIRNLPKPKQKREKKKKSNSTETNSTESETVAGNENNDAEGNFENDKKDEQDQQEQNQEQEKQEREEREEREERVEDGNNEEFQNTDL